MSLEMQACCGALTMTYRDAGRRSHYEWCDFATAENTVRQRRDRPLSCCGAPRAVSAQTGLPFHFEDCSRADEATGTIKRPEGDPVALNPAESRKMMVSVDILFERGLWMAYCAETGMNDWARNEGQVRDGELLPLTEAQAVRIGLLAKSFG